MTLEIIIGIGGMIFILTAFVLDEFYRKFNQETIPYNLLNIVGSFLLLYYAFVLKAWPFLILNAVWLSAATVKLVRVLEDRR